MDIIKATLYVKLSRLDTFKYRTSLQRLKKDGKSCPESQFT